MLHDGSSIETAPTLAARAPFNDTTADVRWGPLVPTGTGPVPNVPLTRRRERLLRRISTRRGREAEGVVLLEGPRVVSAAVASGADVHFAVVEAGAGSPDFPGAMRALQEAGVEVVEVPVGVLAEFSETRTPQGLLCVASEPDAPLPEPRDAVDTHCLVLDRVGDPGNVGTLARTAAALGVDRLVALDGTADPWGAKAVRASAGFVFALPVHRVSWEMFHPWLELVGLPLFVADAAGRDVREVVEGSGHTGRGDPEKGWALLLGSEAEGPRAAALDAARALLRVPISPRVESLNVAIAGSLLLWELGPGREPSEAPS